MDLSLLTPPKEDVVLAMARLAEEDRYGIPVPDFLNMPGITKEGFDRAAPLLVAKGYIHVSVQRNPGGSIGPSIVSINLPCIELAREIQAKRRIKPDHASRMTQALRRNWFTGRLIGLHPLLVLLIAIISLILSIIAFARTHEYRRMEPPAEAPLTTSFPTAHRAFGPADLPGQSSDQPPSSVGGYRHIDASPPPPISTTTAGPPQP